MVYCMNTQLRSKFVVSESGCWVWTAYRDRNGYGKINYGGRPPKGRVHFAHRLIYELEVGPIPEGLVLDHLCRNTGCVNPQHLQCVTQAVNVSLGNAGKHWSERTHCKNGHAFEGDNVRHNGRQRVCRQCKRDSESQRRRRLGMKKRDAQGV